jgi:aminoglycoside 2''-phosphotransferase
MEWSRPAEDEIRETLARHVPQLADASIAFLADGWDVWAFTAGDYVLRFPKRPEVIEWLARESRLLKLLLGRLPLPVPKLEAYDTDGAIFTVHRMLPGVRILEAPTPLGPGVGEQLGRFIRALHAVPVEDALAAGVLLDDGARLRAERAEQYERVIRTVSPLVSCEARTYIETMYESNLNDATNFDYEPVFIHRDLDSNTLVDPETRELTAVIDFGDAIVGNRAFDYWLPVYGFQRLGIPEQMDACLRAAGLSPDELQRMAPELRFIDFRWPLLDIMYGLGINDTGLVEGGIRALNASLPPDLRCE